MDHEISIEWSTAYFEMNLKKLKKNYRHGKLDNETYMIF